MTAYDVAKIHSRFQKPKNGTDAELSLLDIAHEALADEAKNTAILDHWVKSGRSFTRVSFTGDSEDEAELLKLISHVQSLHAEQVKKKNILVVTSVSHSVDIGKRHVNENSTETRLGAFYMHPLLHRHFMTSDGKHHVEFAGPKMSLHDLINNASLSVRTTDFLDKSSSDDEGEENGPYRRRRLQGFFGFMGHVFSSAAHGIAHAAEDVGHGIVHAAEDVGHGVEHVAHTVGEVAKVVFTGGLHYDTNLVKKDFNWEPKNEVYFMKERDTHVSCKNCHSKTQAELHLDVDVDDYHLKKAAIFFDGSTDTKVDGNARLWDRIKDSYSQKIADIPIGTVTFTLGPIPVVITMDLPIKTELDIDMQIFCSLTGKAKTCLPFGKPTCRSRDTFKATAMARQCWSRHCFRS